VKSWLYIILFLLIIAFGFLGYYFFQPENKSEETSHGPCLSANEFADYPIDEKYAKEIGVPKMPLTISVRDKTTKKEKFSFQIENINPEHVHPLEIHKCGVYVIKMINFDPKKTKQEPGFKKELWVYRYDKGYDKILTFAEKDKLGVYHLFYNDNFRIDPTENYLVLEQSYLGQSDYALVIKDLKTKEDVFVLTLDDIKKINPEVQLGNFNLGKFIKDGKYLWGTLFVGASDTAYYRVELGTWKTEIFSPPPDIPSGAERSTSFAGYVVYADITSFTGIKEITKQIEEGARKEGKMKNLWIYNLFTKEKYKIASADPSWRFNLKWISDTELEYYLPSGEREVFNVEKR